MIHSVTCTQPIALLSLFVDASATAGLPDQCLVVDVSPLMRELILRAIAIGNEYPTQGSAIHLMRVILDELQQLKASPLGLPKAKDKRLRRITETYLENPADERNLEDWAPTVGASVRTIERQFVADIGMTFAEWRRQVRLLEAIDRLGKGQPVTRVALDLGYQSPSAFIAMFRRTLGVPPGHYFQNTKD
jgi:AraC-like DNA-binding protein